MNTEWQERAGSVTRRSAGLWPIAGECAHAVQFYEDDAVLLDLLAGFVGTALVTGRSAVVIATAAHRVALAHELRTRGFDVSIPRLEGRYVALDAAAVLDQIVDDAGWPDEARFRDLTGVALERARAAAGDPRAHVFAFGEMVALLWASGRSDAAVRVEELWNALTDERRVSLCCAYPMSAFHAKHHAASFLRICAQHSHVFPAERPA